MDSIKKTIQKISGIRKQYKPGQLLTIRKDVVRVSKTVPSATCIKCYARKMNLQPCAKCIEWKIPQDCYLKLVKKHKG